MNWTLTRKIINWVFAVIALGFGILLVGNSDPYGSPVPTEYGKSGTAAAFQLAKKLGYKVSIESNLLPNYPPGSLVVVVYQTTRKDNDRIDKFVGGKDITVLKLPFSNRFVDRTPALETVTNRLTKQKFTISGGELPEDSSQSFEERYLTTQLFDRKQELPFVTLCTDEKVQVLDFTTPYFLLNEYIDQGDNAALFASLLGTYSGRSKTVVFNTAFYDPSKNSLIASLGPWAEGIWVQAWVVLIALVVTANSRFGLPVVRRARQTGQRNLLDGLKSILIRRKDTVEMAAAVRARIHEIVAKKNRMSKAQVAENEGRYLPSEVIFALGVLETVPYKLFAAQAQKLLKLVEPS